MANWGVTNVQQLSWLTPPPKGHVLQAMETLTQLDALVNGAITEHGKAIHKLPCHPRLAHMLIMAEEDDQLALATDVAAILEERDPLPREAGIDINLRIQALRKYRSEGTGTKRLARIEKVAESYRNMFKIEASNHNYDEFETGVLLAHAYPERIAHARPGNNAQFKLANGRIASIGHKDDLAHEPWLAVAHVNDRENMGKIFMASPLNPKDLAPLVKEKEVITWDTKHGGLIASKDLRIGSIVLQSKPLPDPDDTHLVSAISEAIKNEGRNLLDFNEEVSQWQNRVLSLRKWQPNDGWPDVSTESLLLTNADWLGPYLSTVRKPQDLKKIDLHEVLHSSLDWEKQQLLDELAPTRIEVPSGSKIKLAYSEFGEHPILAVRFQEVFGLADTPLINNGRTPVVMHLLSPGYKPVQITSDLRSFWDNTYYEVKKDLKGRYPKHFWPEDPWSAEAVRGVKKINK